jgi:hypothetical protein
MQMKMPAKEVCSEKDRHASEADAYAAASRRVGNRNDKPAALRVFMSGVRRMAFDEAGRRERNLTKSLDDSNLLR